MIPRKLLILLTPLLLFICLESVCAQEEDLELGGLVIDDTRTKTGADFYESFYQQWSAFEYEGDLIRVEELPSRGRGAQISISLGDELFYRRFVQPRQDIIAEEVALALRTLRNKIAQRKSDNIELSDPDMQGSGIF